MLLALMPTANEVRGRRRRQWRQHAQPPALRFWSPPGLAPRGKCQSFMLVPPSQLVPAYIARFQCQAATALPALRSERHLPGPGAQVTHLVARGQWSDAQFKEAIELCLGGCQQLDGAARQCLRAAAEAKQQQEGAAAAGAAS